MTDCLGAAPADFRAVNFNDLPNVSEEALTEFWRPFVRSCERMIADRAVLRVASPGPVGLMEAAQRALRAPHASEYEIRAYFADHFRAFKILPHVDSNPYPHGFVTGYYEPEIMASLERTSEFVEPVRGRPADLISIPVKSNSVTFSASRLDDDGGMVPYWSRAEIDDGRSKAPIIMWVRDAIELFMVQVQGSARVELPGGKRFRLCYDGKNGHPYESIGRILVDGGQIELSEMSLNSLKFWVRQAGQGSMQAGRALLHRNPSYVFFKLVEGSLPGEGPVGGEGIPLTKLRSIAVDRTIWPYGLPFWLSGKLPMDDGATSEFHRMMVAQDTGSAIVGAARGDIFYGSGDVAGQTAARVRHPVDMFVLMPKNLS